MNSKDTVDSIRLYGDGIGRVEYIQHMGDDLTIVNSARVSFGNRKNALDEKDKKLINYLIKHKHTSTLEHNVVTFKFVVPLFIRSQHHRHRTWSYNEISRRYTDTDLQFYEPELLRSQHKSNRQASTDDVSDPKLYRYEDGGSLTASGAIRVHHKSSVKLYNDLLQSGVCREQARGVLPQNLYTEYYGTCNLNNALKFCVLRLHDGAQWEIQQVAKAMIAFMKTLWPNALKSWVDLLDNEELKEGLKGICAL